MFNKDYHTRAMQTLREHPLIARAKSAGLEVDPSKGRTDYAQYAEWARSSPIGWLQKHRQRRFARIRCTEALPDGYVRARSAESTPRHRD
jgi:hypothetical protein